MDIEDGRAVSKYNLDVIDKRKDAGDIIDKRKDADDVIDERKDADGTADARRRRRRCRWRNRRRKEENERRKMHDVFKILKKTRACLRMSKKSSNFAAQFIGYRLSVMGYG